jgi:flagellar hook-associated protein 1
MGLSAILNVARNAIFANQVAMQVTSHNIANVNTDGYARQEARLEEAPWGLLGNGVMVAGFTRYYDKYLEQTIANRNTSLQQQSTTATYLERIEGILNEDNSNLGARILDFFNGWNELSNDPQNLVSRKNLIAKAQTLSTTFSNLYTELHSMQTELDNNVAKEIGDTNRILSTIADLNLLISQSVPETGEAADFQSRRAELFKELSGKMNVVSFEDNEGELTILSGGGQVLVDKHAYSKLKAIPDAATGYSRIGLEDDSGNVTDITDSVSGGSLRAYTDLRDKTLGEGFIKDIDELAKAIMTEVNSIHERGYDMNGMNGVPFFKEIDSLYAQGIGLSTVVQSDARSIAAAASPDALTGNDIALEIAALGDGQLAINGMTTTITNYISSIQTSVGEVTKNAKALSEDQKSAMTLMEQQRESVSGVSIDEEMTNLMKYQYAYQASARLITVVDEMFQSILEAVK